jgi:signal transduction histidine kinase
VGVALRSLRYLALVAATFLVIGNGAVQAGTPKRVLIIQSFGREFAPYGPVTSAFRKELAKRSDARVVFLEATLDAGRPVTPDEERSIVEYLRSRFATSQPDLVVTIGPPAARLYLAHRDELFPSPLVLSAVEERLVRGASLRPGDGAVVVKVDLPGLFRNIFQVLPDTKTIAVVIGASPHERLWLKELERESAEFATRADLLFLADLSLEQIKERVAQLPPRSAVLFTLMITDAAGVPHERQDAFAGLRAVANAPVFSIHESELGKGVVGGPYTSQRRVGESIAAMADRMLRGAASPSAPQWEVIPFESPIYDQRELERWNIDRARVPPGSEVRFQPVSVWESHRQAIIIAGAVIALQAALIAALLVQRFMRRRAEGEVRALSGRLLTAHEDERRRLARELHDDITQRVAALAIQAGRVESDVGASAAREPARSLREGLAALGKDVHSLSHRLHPTVIEDLGLVQALRAECARVARNTSLPIELDTHAVPPTVRADAAVGLYRVAQEALRNVARHAKASAVRVGLRRCDGRLVLAVQDNGVGFDGNRRGDRECLGLASMRERMRLLDGGLEIDSGPSRGTTITAWIPLPEAA